MHVFGCVSFCVSFVYMYFLCMHNYVCIYIYMYIYMYIYTYIDIFSLFIFILPPPPESVRLAFVVVKYCILAFSFALLNRKSLRVRPSVFVSTASIHEYANGILSSANNQRYCASS